MEIIKYKITGLKPSHRLITKYFIVIIEEPEKVPDWLTTRITHLLQKSGDSKEVINYRPMTCLTTMYKTLTGIITRRISTHLNGKGKAVPLEAWCGPEGSRKLRLPDFMTTAQDGGEVVSLTYRPPLPPGNTPGTHFF